MSMKNLSTLKLIKLCNVKLRTLNKKWNCSKKKTPSSEIRSKNFVRNIKKSRNMRKDLKPTKRSSEKFLKTRQPSSKSKS